jgi:DNA polymerase IV
METTATILHADLDAFYASVEQLLDPSLIGKPIAVGGGVVLAASYEAKAFGVRGGMPGRQARELCRQLTFVSGHFKHYQRLGDAAIKVVNDFTPLVERISIDEAFADVARCTHLFGPPAEIARAIRHRVRTELGLPISVGVARTKHLAKIASQVAKPDGLVVVDPDTELEFLHHLPVELMWGVGPVTKARPAEMGFDEPQLLVRRPRDVGEHVGCARIAPSGCSRLWMTMDIQAQTMSSTPVARALEQGQAHRPEAAVAAKTCLVDPYPNADGRADP